MEVNVVLLRNAFKRRAHPSSGLPVFLQVEVWHSDRSQTADLDRDAQSLPLRMVDKWDRHLDP